MTTEDDFFVCVNTINEATVEIQGTFFQVFLVVVVVVDVHVG